MALKFINSIKTREFKNANSYTREADKSTRASISQKVKKPVKKKLTKNNLLFLRSLKAL